MHKAIYLRQDPSVYSTISIADLRGQCRSPWRIRTWPIICKFYNSKQQSKLPYDYFYDADYNATYNSSDGDLFCFPFNDIPEIDSLKTEFRKSGA